MNSELKPKIRFKGFTDDWEQRKLEDIGDNFSTGTLGYADLSEDGKYKCVLYGDLYTKFNERIFNVKSRTNTEATKVEINDILFPTSTTVDNISLIAPSCVNQANIRVGGDLFGIRPYKNIDGNFISYCINNFSPIKYSFAKQAQGLTIVHLQYNAVKNEILMVPSIDEQKRMSQLFIEIDNLITLHQRKCDKLVELKKSLLEKMFPQNNSVIPEIRFRGFTDDWEQRKLEEFGKYTGGTSIESEFEENGKYKVISIGSYSETSKYNDQGIRCKVSDKTISKVLNKDDLTMILNDKTASGNIIGRVLIIDKSGEYVYNQRTERIEPNIQEYNPQFLYHMLNAPNIRKKIIKQSQGNTQIFVNWTGIQKLEYLVPKMCEQINLAKLIGNIDNLITLHQRKHDKLNKIKQSLLNDMFV